LKPGLPGAVAGYSKRAKTPGGNHKKKIKGRGAEPARPIKHLRHKQKNQSGGKNVLKRVRKGGQNHHLEP